jgi:acyl-CoA thioesterase II
VERAACAYLARAWWGDQLVAESSSAVRTQEPGEPPALYFPSADVRFDLFEDEGRRTTCPVKGTAQLWSIGAPPGAAVAALNDWHETASTALDGKDVLWRFTEPSSEVAWLADFAAFDHDRVRVELVDAREGDDPRDATVKRFPTWGDAADLIDILDVRPDGERRYVSVARGEHRRPVVEGSQMLAQAIVAAGRHAPGRRAVSAHMVFVRGADARYPLHFDIEELSAGRTFTTLAVQVSQGGRRCASGTLLLDVTAPDVIRHGSVRPEVAGPYESAPYDMSVMGRDLRVVDDAYTDDPGMPVGPPVIDAWVRFREVPHDRHLHAGLLAQFTGHMSIAAGLRPHEGIGQRAAHRTLSTAINAIAISLHADVRADEWMLYHHLSTFAGDGMTHSECRVYNEAGDLLASFTVDAMVRRFEGDPSRVDDRRAM